MHLKSSHGRFKREINDESKPIYPGSCRSAPSVCGPEAACADVDNDSHTCVCPHDNSTPTSDLRCPNRLTVPLTPSTILNIIPPSNVGFNSTASNVTSSRPTSKPVSKEEVRLIEGDFPIPLLVATVMLVALMSAVILFTVCCYTKYKKKRRADMNGKRRRGQNAPMSLSNSLLPADRYATNPQYMISEPEQPQSPPVPLPALSRDSLTFSHVIGEGCFGKVYKGQLHLESGIIETVAVKVLKDTATKEAEEDFMREVEIMASFQHSNILSLLGVVFKEPGKSPWMVFEFMSHGDLTEVLRSNSRTFWKTNADIPRLSKESLLHIAKQIASGMQYLAGQHFVHRDLACRNCLMGDNLTVKIADFGMSRDVYTCDYYKVGGSRLLPIRWMSPESITYGRFTLESDVWSFGVVLWEIYSLGKQPYFGHSNEEVVRLILQGIMLIAPEDTPMGICNLMRLCWKSEPKDRISFEKICDRLANMSSPSEPISMGSNLPRPPLFPVAPISRVSSEILAEIPETDFEDYLQPRSPISPHDYLQTLPEPELAI
ncbi:muscle, skeletal receptor tyrosine protein kinase-like [Rhodnius prolixus]|uniref:muscle, skeletal receptor tyrosine protein kinase-like n=1 Tax=Rhodnius prolixus TaxID=13249 RepID=UPI003D18D76B